MSMGAVLGMPPTPATSVVGDDDDDDDGGDDDDDGVVVGVDDDDRERDRDNKDTASSDISSRIAHRPSTVNQIYDRQMERATRLLSRQDNAKVLRIDGELSRYSPKFYKLLRHFESRTYPMLVYSQFRRTEGVGMLSACLDTNGYSRIYVSRDPSTGAFRLRRDRPRQGYPDEERLTVVKSYMVFDNVDKEASRVLLNAFNSDFADLPASAREDAERLLPTGSKSDENLHGNLARLMLVTKSGAEGITLRNVREVHCIEPFWNNNRIEQVIGRAVRAHSHARLPPAERRVDVYLYISTFTHSQADEHSIKVFDNGKTSDEHVLGVANRKSEMVQKDMLPIMKRAAVDCRMHRAEHRAIDGHHACAPRLLNIAADEFVIPLIHPSASHNAAAHSVHSASASPSGQQSVKPVVGRLKPVRLGERKFYKDDVSHRLFDFDALKIRGELVQTSAQVATSGRSK